MRLDASALSSSGSKASGSWACSESVFRYEAWAPVIGSSPVTQSLGSLIWFEFESGFAFGFSTWRPGAVFLWVIATSVHVLFSHRTLTRVSQFQSELRTDHCGSNDGP